MADLLRRRPDVRQAERQIAQATAEIGIAEAARLPRVSLSGSIGVSGNVLNKIKAFQVGVADFTTVISVQQSLNQANEDLVQVQAGQATYLVALDKALGGGYEANGVARAQTIQVAEDK